MKTLIQTALIALLAALPAAAAPIELAVSTNGEGSVNIAGGSSYASTANVILKRDGSFSIGLVGTRDTRMSGRWMPSGRNDVALRIESAAGRNAKGSGGIELNVRRDGSYEIKALEASAVTDKGATVRMVFRAPRVIFAPIAPPPQPPTALIRGTRSGRGVFRAAGEAGVGISHAHVELHPNGRAFVNVYGGITLGYLGTWKSAGPGTRTLEVSGGIAGETITGAIRLDTAANTFTRIELNGTHRRRYYSIEFDALRR